MPVGITEPYMDATISSTAVGTIAVIRKNEGQFVKKGEVVIELESELEVLEVERRKLIAESKVEVDAARHRLETLKLDLEATRHIFEATQSVSEQELLEKELEYKLAEAEMERLLIAEQREDIEYRIAEAQLQKRIITAPFDGVIIELYLKVGENSSPQQPLFRMADTRKCRFIVLVEAAASRKIKQGMQVSIRIEEGTTAKVYKGVVEYASPVVDPSSGLREVKVLFDNLKGEVYPGVSGTLILQ
jgi:RND family efflux transporter MFP subunit